MKSSANRKIRVMIIEDHVLVRMGLVAAANNAPDIEVVAELEDGRQAAETWRKSRADVVILDLRMPGMDGVQIIRDLRQQFEQVRILMLSSYGGADDITRAMNEGACGYVVKGMPLERLLEAIRAVYAGEQFLPDEISKRMQSHENSTLSYRELEVLRLIARGKSNKEIGTHLGIVEGTVKAHLAHIFTKLGAVDRAQAMAMAVKRQLIHLE